MKSVEEGNKMSITECRKILGEKVKDCDDETVKKLRDWLYQMSAIALDVVKEHSISSMEDLVKVLEEKNKGKP
jgi:hypothetical protein